MALCVSCRFRGQGLRTLDDAPSRAEAPVESLAVVKVRLHIDVAVCLPTPTSTR